MKRIGPELEDFLRTLFDAKKKTDKNMVTFEEMIEIFEELAELSKNVKVKK